MCFLVFVGASTGLERSDVPIPCTQGALGARWGRAGCAQAAASACASCIKMLAPQMLAGWGRCVVVLTPVERVISAAGKMHGDLQRSAKDSTLKHSLFAAFNTE